MKVKLVGSGTDEVGTWSRYLIVDNWLERRRGRG